MFGIDAGELLLLIVLAVILFGPDKLPNFARKLARVFVYLRGIANTAQSTLRAELGPEYADLELKDLNPKAFVRKHMAAEIEALEEVQRDLAGVQETIKGAAGTAKRETAGADAAAAALVAGRKPTDKSATAVIEAAPQRVPFDTEAT